MRVLLSCLVMAAALAASGQTMPAAGPALANDPQWKNLIQRLGDPEFAVRQRADEELARYTWRQLSDLRAVVREIEDAEARARVLGRIAQLEQEIGVDPPPITLSVEKATRRQLADALSRATGVVYSALPMNQADDPATLFTLNATDKPYWDAIADLNRQHRLLLRAGGNQITLTRPTLNERFDAAGNFGIFSQAIYRGSDVAAERRGDNPRRQLMLSVLVLPDPRLRTVMYAPATFSAVEDEKGQSLLQGALPQQRFVPGVTSIRDVPLNLPPGAGTRIAVARGEMDVILQLSEASHIFKTPDKELEQPFKVGNRMVRLTQFAPAQDGIQVRVVTEPVSAQPVAPPPAADEPATVPANVQLPIGVALIDRDGIEVARSGYVGALFAGRLTVPAAARGPFAVRVFTPDRAKVMTAKFELRDIPLPR